MRAFDPTGFSVHHFRTADLFDGVDFLRAAPSDPPLGPPVPNWLPRPLPQLAVSQPLYQSTAPGTARRCTPPMLRIAKAASGRTFRGDLIPGLRNCAHGSTPSGPAAYARNTH